MTVRFGLHNDQPVAIAETQLQIQDESGTTRLIYRELNPPPPRTTSNASAAINPRPASGPSRTHTLDLTNSYTITTRVTSGGQLL